MLTTACVDTTHMSSIPSSWVCRHTHTHTECGAQFRRLIAARLWQAAAFHFPSIITHATRRVCLRALPECVDVGERLCGKWRAFIWSTSLIWHAESALVWVKTCVAEEELQQESVATGTKIELLRWENPSMKWVWLRCWRTCDLSHYYLYVFQF